LLAAVGGRKLELELGWMVFAEELEKANQLSDRRGVSARSSRSRQEVNQRVAMVEA
jgi:hypothetical protein